ncbi:hypothetical protein C9J19_20300 [Photobacterium phosphoreum]|uniref:hypothetical protein n=1 Tax=Photobacterium phosphoreum TaxID=659 RepID=UPI000D1770E5|nr:hypothetical protein [Photobacterium phosphoreum]PSW24306.1 hypothetical protein C9J19_20300 [Photobacterium phosphoreum]
MSLFHAAEFVCNSVLANRIAHNARNELYHFLMAVEKYGLDAVVQETRKLLEERGCSYLEASRISIERATYMLEMATGQKTYQPVRDGLNNQKRAEDAPHTARLDYDY